MSIYIIFESQILKFFEFAFFFQFSIIAQSTTL